MTIDDLSKFVSENKERGGLFTTGGVDAQTIQQMEERLGVLFCESYREFLSTFGYLELFGRAFLGFSKGNYNSVVHQTEVHRQFGLPTDLIVVENADEFLYCMRTGPGRKDSEVFTWDRSDPRLALRYAGFFEYVLDVLEDMKYNDEPFEE